MTNKRSPLFWIAAITLFVIVCFIYACVRYELHGDGTDKSPRMTVASFSPLVLATGKVTPLPTGDALTMGAGQIHNLADPSTAQDAATQAYVLAHAGVSDSINVQSYGAVGDGKTDDRLAIITAITAASALQLKLFVPKGVYEVSQDGGNNWCIDWPASNVTMYGIHGASVIQQMPGLPIATSLFRMNQVNNVTIQDITIDGDWGNAQTTIDYPSNLAVLPQGTINVVSTVGFPSSGTFTVFLTSGAQVITYAGLTPTSFTGCTGGTGTLVRNAAVGWVDGVSGINQTTTADPSNFGLFIRGSTNIWIVNDIFQQQYGDGIWMGTPANDDLWSWASDIHIVGNTFTLMARNGVTFGSGAQRVWIQNNTFVSEFTSAVHGEPGEYFTANREIYIDHNIINGWWDPQINSQIVVQLAGAVPSGNNQSSSARDWRIEDNLIYGAVYVDTAIDIVIARNRIVVDRDAATSAVWAPIFVDHTADDVTIDDNYIYDNLTKSIASGDPHNGSICVQLYASGNVNLQPAGVRVTNNRIHSRKGVNGIWIDAQGGFSTGDATSVVAAVTGTSTSTTATTLVDSTATWTAHQWIGWQVITQGVTGLIIENTGTTLTLQTSTATAPFNPTPIGWRTPLGQDEANTPALGTYTITSVSGVVDIRGNDIDLEADGNTAGGDGIFLFFDRAGSRAHVENNKIKGATSWGIEISGASSKPALALELVDNKFWDDQAVPTMSAGIRFDNAPSLTSIVRLEMRGNTLIGGVSTLLSNVSSGTWLVDDGVTPAWDGYGSPEGVVTAPVSSTYQRLDGGAGTSFYVKESGSGNTGWNINTTVAGNLTVNGTTSVTQFSGTVISPAGITGTVNDWAPTGLATATAIYMTSSGGNVTLTGLTGCTVGRYITLINGDASARFTIEPENAGSLAADRFVSQWGSDNITLAAGLNSNVTYLCTAVTAGTRWLQIAGPTFEVPELALSAGNLNMSGNNILAATNITDVGITTLGAQAQVISGGTPSPSHGSIGTGSTNWVGNITGIGANTSTVLTFSTTFANRSWCFAQPNSTSVSVQVIVVTNSASAPTFSCFTTSTGSAANCNDFSYQCVGE
jgi:hypothetical protein